MKSSLFHNSLIGQHNSKQKVVWFSWTSFIYCIIKPLHTNDISQLLLASNSKFPYHDSNLLYIWV